MRCSLHASQREETTSRSAGEESSVAQAVCGAHAVARPWCSEDDDDHAAERRRLEKLSAAMNTRATGDLLIWLDPARSNASEPNLARSTTANLSGVAVVTREVVEVMEEAVGGGRVGQKTEGGVVIWRRCMKDSVVDGETRRR